MGIVGARWTPRVNLLDVRCHCGRAFEHRADRGLVRCPACRFATGVGPLRERYRRQETARGGGKRKNFA